MDYTILIIMLALLQYLYFTVRTGLARGKFNVAAPATVGDQHFERKFRIQNNTLEQLIIFIPSMVVFAKYVSPLWAAILGIIFIVGRFLYFFSYSKDPEKRLPGMVVTIFSNVVLLVGAIVGLLISTA